MTKKEIAFKKKKSINKLKANKIERRGEKKVKKSLGEFKEKKIKNMELDEIYCLSY